MTVGDAKAAAVASFKAWLGDKDKGPERYRALLRQAFLVTKTVHDAKDRLHEAILAIQTGARSWDPTKSAEQQLEYMMWVIESVHSNYVTAEQQSVEAFYADPFKRKGKGRVRGTPKDSEEGPEATALDVLVSLHDANDGAAWVGRVRAACKPGSLEERIAVASQAGHETVDEQMAATGATREEVKRARRNLRDIIQTRMGAALRRLDPRLARAPAGKSDQDTEKAPDSEPEQAS